MSESKPLASCIPRQEDTAVTPRIDIREGTKVCGYGEKFDVSRISGAPSLCIPVRIPEIRGFAPKIELAYSGDRQNGPFGLGFSLGISAITRLTGKGVPQYDDGDRFMLSGAELTPAYVRKDGRWIRDERREGGWQVAVYRQRIQTDFQRVEWWKRSDASFWKVVDADNAVSVFGQNQDGRIFDPSCPAHVFQWNIESRTDARGNAVRYIYRRENTGDASGCADDAGAQLYISSIHYGNYHDHAGEERYAAEVLFDYGEYDPPALVPKRDWTVRTDCFSTFRSGFELRTKRLCHAILTAVHFPDEPGVGRCLREVLRLEYGEESGVSLLGRIQCVGYRKERDGGIFAEELPPVVLRYGKSDPHESATGELKVDGLPPFTGRLGDGNWQFTDLWGDGIAGILYNDRSTIAYWRALGDGRYAPLRERLW